MGVGDFFSAEAGQARRKWLDDQANSLMYYVPPEIRPWVNMADQALPTTQFGNTISASQDMLDPSLPSGERWRAGGDMAAGVLGVVAPMGIASKAGAPVANAVMEGLMNYGGPAKGALQDFAVDESGALRLWHGSPHDFDRFDMSKIGTGEGAQAYGHGLYFAESQGVAKSYRDALSNLDAPLAVWKRADGSEIDGFDVPGAVSLLRGDRVDVSNADLLAAAEKELARASGVRNAMLRSAQVKKAQEAIDWLKQNNGVFLSSHPERGRLYEVNVDADPADFLDWDKALSEQPEKVREWAEKRFEQLLPGRDISQFDGSYAWRAAHPQADIDGRGWLDSSPAQDATNRLRQAGIPGIRYLDAGSRGAGDGSRNYVVFDDKLITILKKYGLLPAAMGGTFMSGSDAQAGQ